MSRLYPSLEDMKVDQMQQAQQAAANQVAAPPQIQYPMPGQPGAAPAYGAATAVTSLYPSLDDYMGLDLALVRQTTPQNQVQVSSILLKKYSMCIKLRRQVY